MQASKLQAFANQGPHPAGKSAKGKPPAAKAPKQEIETDNDGDELPDSDDPMAEAGSGKYGALIPELEKCAEQIGQLTDEFDPMTLRDFDEELEGEDVQAMEEGLDRLPPDFVDAFHAAVEDGEMSSEEAQGLADHLAKEELGDVEPELIAGWLYHASKVV